MAQHSKWSASGCHRWINCPGSIQAVDAIPEKVRIRLTRSSIYADEGTAAHWIGDRCLKTGKDAEVFEGEFLVVDDEGEVAQMTDAEDAAHAEAVADVTAHEVTHEMVDGVQLYLDTVRKEHRSRPGSVLSSEERADLSFIRPGLFGTRDAKVAEPFGWLGVFDLKYGKGVPVIVDDNDQEKYYALEDVHRGNFDIVELCIVQPRHVLETDDPPGVRRWSTTADELIEWGNDVLGPAYDRTLEPDAPRIPGKWCMWCINSAFCKEKEEMVMREAQFDFEEPATMDKFLDLSILERAYKAQDLLDQHAKAVQAAVDALLRSGRELDFAKLVRPKTNRKYIVDEETVVKTVLEQVKELKLKLKKGDLYAPPKLKSPRQIELLSRKLKPVVETLAEAPETDRVVVAPIDDPRPAVVLDPAADFGEDDQ